MKLRIFLGCSAIIAAWLFALPAHAQGKDAAALVAQLYSDFAWEAKADPAPRPGQSLLEQPRQILARYFDDNLTRLILKDRACVAKTHEVCKLDFSPIWASQDPGASELMVSPSKDPAVVAVKIRYPESGQITEMSYHLSRTKLGWRVHDIVYSTGGSLLWTLRPNP